MPTADSKPEGTVSFTFNKNKIWKFGTLSVSPFNWLEAGYFYYRPSDVYYDKKGGYLDKGFNIKFIYRPKNPKIPNLAIGLDDFSGTGLFTKEYIVASNDYKNTIITFGLGWGKFVGNKSFKNPLDFISDSLLERPVISDNYDRGGQPSYDQWFRGNVSPFGGIEYVSKNINNLKIKVEYDPLIYTNFSYVPFGIDSELRKKDSKINFGLSYPWNRHLNFELSYLKGNTINFSFNYSIHFNDNLSKKPNFSPKIAIKANPTKSKQIFYENLLSNLNSNRLLLQTANLSTDKVLDISISTSDHRNAIRSSSYASHIAHIVAKKQEIELNKINITHINVGVELNTISYISKYLDKNNNIPLELKIRNTEVDSGNKGDYLTDEFKPSINFPVIFSSLRPSLVSYVGNPGKFYFGNINLDYKSEVHFNRNLLLSSEISYTLSDSFSKLPYNPDSVLQHVRTDLTKYLQEDDLHINRMQFDYIWSPYKNIYSKLTGGILEPMFAGVGGQTVYKPFDKNYSIGYELFYVKQRTYKKRFNLQDYETITGHINLGYKFAAGIEASLSYGRYLAKDYGFTLDLARTTKSGFKSGIYFTRTNISADTFGEGSFDKGFYFQIPLDLLSNEFNGSYTSFKLSPLTRDGGAKLIHDKELSGLIYNSTIHDLIRQWDGYLN